MRTLKLLVLFALLLCFVSGAVDISACKHQLLRSVLYIARIYVFFWLVEMAANYGLMWFAHPKGSGIGVEGGRGWFSVLLYCKHKQRLPYELIGKYTNTRFPLKPLCINNPSCFFEWQHAIALSSIGYIHTQRGISETPRVSRALSLERRPTCVD